MTPEERADAVMAAAAATQFPAVFEIGSKTVTITDVRKANDVCVGFTAYVQENGVYLDVDPKRYVVNPSTHVADGLDGNGARVLREAPLECLARVMI